MIKQILGAEIVRYQDSGQVIAYVLWKDDRDQRGTTSGDPEGGHMRALLARAERERVRVYER